MAAAVPDDATPEQLVAILLKALQGPGNEFCMDCGERAPKWAVVNWGVYVCIRCSGHHRNMGVHISKVKSVNLDKWTPEEVRWMLRMGNARAKEGLEARIKKSARLTPQSTDGEVSAALKLKYAELKFSKEGKKPPTLKAWLRREAKKERGGGERGKEKKDKKDKKGKKAKRPASDDDDDDGDADDGAGSGEGSSGGDAAGSDAGRAAAPKAGKREKKDKRAKAEHADLLSFFSEGSPSAASDPLAAFPGAPASPDAGPAGNGNGSGGGGGDVSGTNGAGAASAEAAKKPKEKKEKKEKEKREKKEKAAAGGGGDGVGFGGKAFAFGEVTGDKATVAQRRDELLALFS